MAATKESKTATVSDADLKAAEEAHGRGEPLPNGITFAPYNNPPYVATEEYEATQADLAGANMGVSGSAPVAEGSSPPPTQ